MYRRGVTLVAVATQLWLTAGCEQTAGKERKKADSPAGPTFLKPAEGSVADAVRKAQEEVGEDPLLVYVSAEWCEPCRHFQSAVDKGLLDRAFPRLRLLKFDSDVDEPRLAADGYDGQMIPRFVRPAEDGTASASRFEGSIKGPGAVDNIVPKLKDLLAQ